MKKNEIIYSQLLALRLQVDSLIQMVEDTIENEEETKEIECNHPNNFRINMDTMGDDREKFKCRKCGKNFIDGMEVENF